MQQNQRKTLRTPLEIAEELERHWQLFEIVEAEAQTPHPRPDSPRELEEWIKAVLQDEQCQARAFELVGRIAALKWVLGEEWDSAMLWNDE